MSNLSIDDLAHTISDLLAERAAPIIVAIDGPSGGGKSTIAQAVTALLPATLVGSDDFFAADLTRAEWDARSGPERARDAIDWQRLRRCALEPLRAGRRALWQPFDFSAGERADGSYGMASHIEERAPAPVIVVEGAYSSRPELADLLDLTVFVAAPEEVRRARLEAREEGTFIQAWHERWDVAEAHYFQHVRPPQSFDIVIDTVAGRLRDLRPRESGAPLLPNER